MILRSLVVKSFGELPSWAEDQLTVRTVAELEELAARLLAVPSLKDLLRV
jgi:hypothetical protein